VPLQEILILTALIIWTVIGAGLIVAMLALGPQLRRTLREMSQMADVMTNQALPALEHSQEILEQISRISTVLMADVEVVDHTVIRAMESIDRMVELAEARVSEVNALVSVAVEEAEETFLSTADLLRALRLGRGKKRKLSTRERRRFG